MEMYRKIIVGVDGSELATKALKQAIELAKKFSSEILAVNVFQNPAAEGLSHEILEKAKKLLEEGGVKHETSSILSPNPPKTINKMAEEDRTVDLVVVGSRGVSDVRTYLLGSVSHKILHDCPVSVLVVR